MRHFEALTFHVNLINYRILFCGSRYGRQAEFPQKRRLARPHCETYWSRISRWIVRNFRVLIVSAVKI